MPFTRVTGLQVHQSLLLRFAGLYEVMLESSGSEQAALVLPAVSTQTLTELRGHLRRDQVAGRVGAGDDSISSGLPGATQGVVNDSAQPLTADKPVVVHGLSARELTWLSVTSIQTLFLGPFLFGTFSRMESDVSKKWLWMPIKWLSQQHFGWLSGRVLPVMVALLATIMIAIIWGMWRYWGYRLQYSGNEWHQQSGLLTPYLQTMQSRRACAVIWKQNPLQYRLGRGWLRIAVVGEGSGNGNRQAEKRGGGRCSAFRVPWIAYPKVLKLQKHLFANQAGVLAKAARYQAVSPLYLWRNRVRYVLSPMLLMLVLAGYFLSLDQILLYWFLPALIWLVVGEWRLRWHYRRWRFAISGEALRVQFGCWGCTRMFVPWSALQTVRLKQSFQDRRLGLASIELILPFGKVRIPCLPLSDAQIIFDYAASRAIL